MPGFLLSLFHNPWILLGLVVLAIPIIIHLLNRRRYDIIDWGAMQFLQISEVTRRKILIEELLLLLLRMALLAILVFVVADMFLPAPVAAATGWLVGAIVALLVAAIIALSFSVIRSRPWLLALVLVPVAAICFGLWEYVQTADWAKQFTKSTRPNRDVVLIFDASASMTALDPTGTKSPAKAAQEWALNYIEDLIAGDNVAVYQAREQPVPLVGELSIDRKRTAEVIRKLPPPSGSANWPEAVKQAHAVLARGPNTEREIILLSDGQKFSWSDPDTLFRWELLSAELGYRNQESTNEPRPVIRVVQLGVDTPESVAGAKPAPIPNWALAPLSSNRPVVPVGREVSFRSEILMGGQKEYVPPHKLRLEVDGKPVRDVPPPKQATLENGKVPVSFTYRFGTPGSHLVSLILEADRPPDQRPEGYVLRDRVPGDNRQDFSVEVVGSLPVLLVDGDTSSAASGRRGVDFLRDALSPARDRHPVVQARVIGINEFSADSLAGENRPRVVVFGNVASLNQAQQEAVSRFLVDGGGVLLTLGDRVDVAAYDTELYRDGEGWLPARLDGSEGDESKPKDAARPDPGSFSHPALTLFRELGDAGLGAARFSRWMKLTTPGKHSAATTAGLLRTATAAFPFLVERTWQAGRVMVCAAPLDNTWNTNLTDTPAFVPLAHELIYYLAGARSAEFNLAPGQAIRYRMAKSSAADEFQLQPPSGARTKLTTEVGIPDTLQAQVLPQDRGAVLVFEGVRETGVWRLTTPDNATVYYSVQSDPRESDLTPSSEEDREKVKKFMPLTYTTEGEAEHRAAPSVDIWLYLLLGMIALLCSEVWMTRRMVMHR
jgi:Aerotolerance regulator N-terminal/von Willebrand factor type A domain